MNFKPAEEFSLSFRDICHKFIIPASFIFLTNCNYKRILS